MLFEIWNFKNLCIIYSVFLKQNNIRLCKGQIYCELPLFLKDQKICLKKSKSICIFKTLFIKWNTLTEILRYFRLL